MKYVFTLLCAVMFMSAQAQVVITAADMPVVNDTLRYSVASPATTIINPSDSGAGISWTYSLTPISQSVDTFRTATAVNFLYGLTISPSAYGYKVADSFPGSPVPIHQVYTFFQKKTTPVNCYQAVAFAANVSGLPTPSNYSTPDTWFFFPLTYGNTDSSNYALNISLATIGALKQVGYRKTHVDGWGTITTPYYPAGISCIRVRSEIHEIDSVTFGTAGTFGIPRNSVEYKWLVNGDHYPALFVTSNIVAGTERVTSIKYRDSVRSFDTAVVIDTTPVDNGVRLVTNNVSVLKAYPNPTISGLVTIDVPKSWMAFEIQVMDNSSRRVAAFSNKREINIGSLPPGNYVAQVTSGDQVGYVIITR
jgi:hypothetical protein